MWTDDSRHPEAEVHTGSADRERENRRLASYTNTNISNHNNIHASAPPVAHATAATTDSSSLNQSLVYRADGTIAR